MMNYAKHQMSQPKTRGGGVPCLLCRSDWAAAGVNVMQRLKQDWDRAARKARREGGAQLDFVPGAPGSDFHKGTKCMGCAKAPIVGARYSCVLCVKPRHELCSNCFGRGARRVSTCPSHLSDLE